MIQTAMAKHHHPDPSVGIDVNLILNHKEKMCSLVTYDDCSQIRLKWIDYDTR